MKLPEFKETVPLMLEIFNEPFGITRQYQVTRFIKKLAELIKLQFQETEQMKFLQDIKTQNSLFKK